MTTLRFAAPQPGPEPFRRGRETLAAYVLLALLTSGYGMLGPLMPFLRSELGLSYAQGAYHTVAMALGTTMVGLLSIHLVRRIGRRGAIGWILLLMAAGLALVCGAQHLVFSLLGALLLGSSIALAVAVVPAVMSERHRAHLGVAMAEANVFAYLGIFIVPGIVSLAALSVGWRWSLLLPVLCYGLFWLWTRRMEFGTPAPRPAQGTQAELPLAYWCHWVFLGLSVACEFCLVVWGASFLENAAGLPRDMALLGSMVFPAGMIAGRLSGVVLMRRLGAAALALPSLLLATLGILLFVTVRDPLVGSAGLFLCGIGMANCYPLGITLAMFAAPGAGDAASARASLASGAATLFAPLTVGAIADQAGMAAAFSVIPGLLVLAGIAHLAGLSASRRAQRAG